MGSRCLPCYGLKKKDEFPNYLIIFLIDFSHLFRGVHVCELSLRSENAAELNSAQVQQVRLDKRIKRHFSNPGQQFQNGTGKKCIGDLWLMRKT